MEVEGVVVDMGVEVGSPTSSCASFLSVLASSALLEGVGVGALVGVGVDLLTRPVRPSSSTTLALSRISKVKLGFETTAVPTKREMTRNPSAKRLRGSTKPF